MKLPSFQWSPQVERAARTGLILIGLGLLLFTFVRIIIRPIGDFHYHWQLGSYLLNGRSLYLGPGGGPPQYPNPYPPFWAMVYAPLTIVSAHLAQILVFLPLYLGSLGLLLWTLRRLTQAHLPLDRTREFWATALAMLIGVQFLARDMAECGVNIALVVLAWFGIYAWTRHRDWLAGASLGLAIALKMTAALFVPYFLWKRQWKMAGAATLFAILFSLAPVLVRGPTLFATDLREWVVIVRGIGSENPSLHVPGQESTRNFALRPTLTRLIVNASGKQADPYGTNLLSLAPGSAPVLVYVVEIALVIVFAWVAGRSVGNRQSLAVVYECAGVSLLMLLLSPITWGHHCVGTLPALYLIFRTAFYYRSLPGWMLVPLGYVILALAFNRAIIGKQLSLLLSGYSVVTWEIVALLVLMLGCRHLDRMNRIYKIGF
jgi:alpha-1,2-mannosyltransferase